MAHSAIAELLGKIGMLDERQVDAVMSRAGSHAGGHVVQQVAEMGYASESAVARAISIELGLPRIDLTMTPPEPDALLLLDGRVCLDRLVLPVALRENGELLWLAMADPTDTEAVNFVRRKTQMRVRPAVAGPTEIIRVTRAHYGVQMPRMSSAKGEHELGAIEIADQSAEEEGEAMEVVNVMDESASPLARLARQLGVEVPQNLHSANSPPPIDVPEQEPDATAVDLRPPEPAKTPSRMARALAAPATGATPSQFRPQPPSRTRPPPPVEQEEIEIEIDDSPQGGDDEHLEIHVDPEALSPDELHTLQAIQESLEKGAHVLKTLVTLCVEKGVFSKDELARRRRDS